MGIDTQKVGFWVGIGRGVLGFLTDIKDALPKVVRAPLQYGRDRGWWQIGQGPTGGGSIHP